jgi:hypothetical protein
MLASRIWQPHLSHVGGTTAALDMNFSSFTAALRNTGGSATELSVTDALPMPVPVMAQYAPFGRATVSQFGRTMLALLCADHRRLHSGRRVLPELGHLGLERWCDGPHLIRSEADLLMPDRLSLPAHSRGPCRAAFTALSDYANLSIILDQRGECVIRLTLARAAVHFPRLTEMLGAPARREQRIGWVRIAHKSLGNGQAARARGRREQRHEAVN